jgi:cytochrome oxidase Cu insertion factor (SCO1/SenC/PrrC family)
MKNDKMKKVKRNLSASRQFGFLSSKQALVLLGLMFMAPAFVAWVMHNSSEQGWRPDGTTNRGVLVHPARPLTLPADMMIAATPANDYLQGKWTLLYIGDADCDAVCNENLYKMRQVRTAQNEHMRRVQQLYLVLDEVVPESLQTMLDNEYKKMAVTRATVGQAGQIAPYFLIDGVSMQAAERVYIVDPLGNLMMFYPPDANPSGMLKDLKKLLKFSKIG